MKRFLEVAPEDFVAIERITNLKIAEIEIEKGNNGGRWAVLAYVDYGPGSEVVSNAVYILSRHDDRKAARHHLAKIVEQCGGGIVA